jgi:hypothetical protein
MDHEGERKRTAEEAAFRVRLRCASTGGVGRRNAFTPQTRERVNQHILVDTVAERIDQPADHRIQWARRTKTRYRDRPREQWITIPVPSIIDTDTVQHSRHAPSENRKWSPARQPEAVRVRVSYVNV